MPAQRGNYKRKTDATKSARPTKGTQAKNSRGSRPSKPAKSRSSQSQASQPRREGRAQEILGVLLIAFAVLVSIACLTYSPEDSEYLSGDQACGGFPNLIAPSPFCISNVQNAGGPLGAWIAEAVVWKSFGYVSLLLAILLIVCGYQILRKRSLGSLTRLSLILITSTGYFAVLIGRVDMSLDGVSLALFCGNGGVMRRLGWPVRQVGWGPTCYWPSH